MVDGYVTLGDAGLRVEWRRTPGRRSATLAVDPALCSTAGSPWPDGHAGLHATVGRRRYRIHPRLHEAACALGAERGTRRVRLVPAVGTTGEHRRSRRFRPARRAGGIRVAAILALVSAAGSGAVVAAGTAASRAAAGREAEERLRVERAAAAEGRQASARSESARAELAELERHVTVAPLSLLSALATALPGHSRVLRYSVNGEFFVVEVLGGAPGEVLAASRSVAGLRDLAVVGEPGTALYRIRGRMGE